MTTIDENEYSRLYGLYEREFKRVEVYKNRELTKKESKKLDYKNSLVRTYNNLLYYLNSFTDKGSNNDQIEIQNRIVTILGRLKGCFQLLKLDYPYDTNIQALIDINNLTESGNSDARSEFDDNSDSSTNSVSSVKENQNAKITRKKSSVQNKTSHKPHRPRENSSSSEEN